jgi:hypothetical protein
MDMKGSTTARDAKVGIVLLLEITVVVSNLAGASNMTDLSSK